MDNKESLKIKHVNLVVYVQGLQDPFVREEDKSPYRWTNADIGKLYSFKCVTMPLDMRLSEMADQLSEEGMQAHKARVQEYFRVEFYSKLAGIEHFRKKREDALSDLIGPFKMIETSPEEAVQYIRSLDSRSVVNVEEVVEAVLRTTTKEQNRQLMETIGLAVKRGAQDYVSLKKANDIEKKRYWKLHREYDLVLLSMLDHFREQKFMPPLPLLRSRMVEDLKTDNYRESEVPK